MASHSLGAGCQVSSRGSRFGSHGGSWTGNRSPDLLSVTYPAWHVERSLEGSRGAVVRVWTASLWVRGQLGMVCS